VLLITKAATMQPQEWDTRLVNNTFHISEHPSYIEADTYITKHISQSSENVSQLKYLGTTVTDQNLIKEEIKRRLNSGKACYHSVQNLFSSRLLSKNVKVRIHRL
jgi:hypothetical protein